VPNSLLLGPIIGSRSQGSSVNSASVGSQTINRFVYICL